MLKRVLGEHVDQNAKDFLDLMAEDAVMEFPFARPGRPKKVSGHADLTAYLEPLADILVIESFTDPVVHWTLNPKIVILEFSITGHSRSNGQPYNQSYVEIITLEGGKIKNIRDYWNPLLTQSLSA
ncbi:nuclear transport factor 2 family protein [Bradyrhizobium sp. dw_78]|uniref:nuclear transport factor 2 family protein n=1 Tax=Bradyrhizobium sp. dw_78 TaxID=2719793 RepID=UPI001BD5DC98|nr:nuclear transport factor 2 family protein [Bradyrhizobium sp. dw_78]